MRNGCCRADSHLRVRNHFGAIKALYMWVDNKQAVDILNSAAWQLSIKGIVNTVRPSYNILAAMIPDDLVAMVEAAASSLELAPLMVVLTFGFIGYLSVSNMAPPKASEFDPSRHTTVGDVFLRNEGLMLSLKWSKSRQRPSYQWLSRYHAWAPLFCAPFVLGDLTIIISLQSTSQ